MNKMFVLRQIGDIKVTIQAEYIQRLELYGITARINGELYDVRHVDTLSAVNPLIQEAFQEATESVSDEDLMEAQLA